MWSSAVCGVVSRQWVGLIVCRWHCVWSNAVCGVVQPAVGGANRLPVALCVLSRLREASLYHQLLCAAETRFQSAGADSSHDLLRSAYNAVCPLPSHDVNIRTAVCVCVCVCVCKRLRWHNVKDFEDTLQKE